LDLCRLDPLDRIQDLCVVVPLAYFRVEDEVFVVGHVLDCDLTFIILLIMSILSIITHDYIYIATNMSSRTMTT